MRAVKTNPWFARLTVLALVAAFAVAAAALLFLSLKGPDWLKATIDRTSPDGSADAFDLDRVRAIVQRARTFGLFFALVAGGILAIIGPASRVARRVLAGTFLAVASTPRVLAGFVRANPLPAVLLFLVTIAGIAARLTFLHQEIRGDEAANYLQFAHRHIAFAISDYAHPNNHLLFTLLAHACDRVFGGALWSIRLPVFLTGVALVPATFLLARAFYRGMGVALLAAALVAFQPYLVFYATSARGYTLVVLAFVLCLLLARRLVRAPSWTTAAAFSLVGALGFFAIPTMLIPMGGVVLWLALEALATLPRPALPRRVARLAVAGIAMVVLVVALYTPVFVISGVESVTGNRFVQRMGDPEFRDEMIARSRDFFAYAHAGLPAPVVVALLALTGVGILAHARAALHRVPAVLVIAAWSLLFVYIKHAAPYGRVWTFALPLYMTLAAVGLSALLWILIKSASLRHRLFAGAAVALALALAIPLWGTRAVERIPEGALFESPREVVDFASRLGEHDRVLMTWPALPAVEFYAFRAHLPEARIAREGDTPFSHVVIERGCTLEEFNEKLAFGGLAPLQPGQLADPVTLKDGTIYRLDPPHSPHRQRPAAH